MAERDDVVVILDRSGSMEGRKADHEGGLRSFVRDAQKLAGDVRLTFVRFDSHDPCEVVFEGRPLAEIKPEELTLVPRGGTPLLDAVGEALTRFAGYGAGTVVMIITDGQENESRKWTKAKVKELVAARETAGWKVLYLGANVDAFAEAGAVGIAPTASMNYAASKAGIHNAYQVTAANFTRSREVRAAGAAWSEANTNMDYTAQQRDSAMAQDDEEAKP